MIAKYNCTNYDMLVLTPFLGTCLGWQDKVAVRCLQSGLPMREKLNVTKSTGSNMVPMAR